MTTATSTVRFPGETTAYRDARDRLLDSERELRRLTEQVAAERRRLPLGGGVAEDYVFDEGAEARQVRLSELFGNHQTLVIYNFMYGPNMKQACVSCTSILDGLDGAAPHIAQRVGLAVVARSPIQRIREFAAGRGWTNLRLISSANNTYNADYHGETSDGSQMPMLNVFARRDGAIHHTYGTELLYAPHDPGQDGRHVDTIWPIWNMFDFTPDGRGKDWYPKLKY